MSFIVHFIAFMSITFEVVTSDLQYSNASLQCLDQIDIATIPHWKTVKFLQTMMKVDYLWWSVLDERVRVKEIIYYNQYGEFKEETKYHEVLALENISELLSSKALPAKDVKFTMEVVKNAMVCSALKHISFQGLVLYQLLLTVTSIERMEKLLFVMWMVDMVNVVIEKLTTLNDTELLLLFNIMHEDLNHLHRSILKEETSELDIEFLQIVGKEMFNEVKKLCVIAAEGEGYYNALVTNLNRTKWIDDLKAHHVLITEIMYDSTDIVDIDTTRSIKGPIEINNNIDADSIAELDEPELKRAYGANFVQTNFLFENLPVHTLIASQWKTIHDTEERYKAPVTDDSPVNSQFS